MEVILAKSAGFCFGVKLAVDCAYKNALTDTIYTYGPIIHNKIVVSDLEKHGVKCINSIEEFKKLDDNKNFKNDLNIKKSSKIIIRSHGIPLKVYNQFDENKINYIDCTCPFVKKIHKIVYENYKLRKSIIIIGNKNHPEIIGINGFCENNAIILEDFSQVESFINKNNHHNIQNLQEKIFDEINSYILVVQTTFDINLFRKIKNVIINKNNIEIFNTICNATNERQAEALLIAQNVDIMIVLGDINSSNTQKLFSICKEKCPNTYLCEKIQDLQLNNLSKNVKIGVTAGASTPLAIIKEALNKMSEIEEMSFEEMLNESFRPLHNGSIVKGSVIRVTDSEVFVNLGYKADGIISKAEFSSESNIDLKSEVAEGDEIEVFVVKVNDGDGNVLLSRKRLEMNKGYDELEEAFNNQTILKGKVVDTTKGGLITMINNMRVFVPSSQISNRFVQDLNAFKGQELDFKIIEFNKAKRRIVAGRKELAQNEENIRRAEIFATIQPGNKIDGIVNRIVDFGAFINIGGVDGLVHISELSWGRVRNVNDVLKVGDKVSVYVLEADENKNKISLSLKDATQNPWVLAKEKYNVSDIVKGRVVRLVDFGAFVELEPGIDALVHISQISQKHIAKAEEILAVGDTVEAKITEIDTNSKKISLSIKELDAPLEGEE